METNPYEAPTAAITEPPVPACNGSGDKVRHRFHWQTVPTALSWFAATLLLTAHIVWLYQIGSAIVHGDTFDGFWLVAPSMTLVLLASAVLNFWAGRRWMRHCYVSAVTFNAVSGLLLWGVSTVLESHIVAG